ncbi:MAG: hypothetical protein HY002_09950 [Candidatus Rokubacteria bacterium]|nr:hypothetical protein [Candidatus Rokubacteria bacterium]
MSFFEPVAEREVPPEARPYIEIVKRRTRSERIARNYYIFARHPRLVKALVQAQDELIPIPNRFGAVQGVAGMLIAHAKRCRSCFEPSREFLLKLGFDATALDKMCEAPAELPLPERDRRFVQFTLRVALEPEGLAPDDFREVERAGFSKDEVLEMIGVAGFWNLAITLSSAVDAGCREG